MFTGGTNDRKFRAFNASTGEVLWEAATPSGATGVREQQSCLAVFVALWGAP